MFPSEQPAAVLSAERRVATSINSHRHDERGAAAGYQCSEGEDQRCGGGHRGSEEEAEGE